MPHSTQRRPLPPWYTRCCFQSTISRTNRTHEWTTTTTKRPNFMTITTKYTYTYARTNRYIITPPIYLFIHPFYRRPMVVEWLSLVFAAIDGFVNIINPWIDGLVWCECWVRGERRVLATVFLPPAVVLVLTWHRLTTNMAKQNSLMLCIF